MIWKSIILPNPLFYSITVHHFAELNGILKNQNQIRCIQPQILHTSPIVALDFSQQITTCYKYMYFLNDTILKFIQKTRYATGFVSAHYLKILKPSNY